MLTLFEIATAQDRSLVFSVLTAAPCFQRATAHLSGPLGAPSAPHCVAGGMDAHIEWLQLLILGKMLDTGLLGFGSKTPNNFPGEDFWPRFRQTRGQGDLLAVSHAPVLILRPLPPYTPAPLTRSRKSFLSIYLRALDVLLQRYLKMSIILILRSPRFASLSKEALV